MTAAPADLVLDTRHRFYVSLTPMPIHKRLKRGLVSAFIVIAIVFTAFTGIRADSDEDAARETIVAGIVRYLKDRNVKGPDDRLRKIAHTVYEESEAYSLDYRLVLAVMKVESNFRHDAVSKRGARGLLQIKPSLARHVSRNAGVQFKSAKCLNEPEKNIKIGVNHLSWLMEKFESVQRVLHAYNVGHHRAKVSGTEEKAENSKFTKKVLREYEKISAELPDPEDL